jgi:phosphoglycerate dehydrogenase-like enzyme
MRSTGNKFVVAVLRDASPQDVEKIMGVAPGLLEVVPLWRSLRPDTERFFPEAHIKRFERPDVWMPDLPKAEVDRVLGDAQAAFSGAVHPSDLLSRMPNLRWVHFSMAGLSSIQHSEFWESRVDVTTSRGYTGARSIAEMAVFGGMMIAKGFQIAVRQTDAQKHDGKAFAPARMAQGKTMGVVGLGGIGENVAKLAKGIGMRVVGSRRSTEKRGPDLAGVVDELFPAADLMEMLSECDFVALCMPATPETVGLFTAEVFAAIKPGAIFINVARGEIVDEGALVDALESGSLSGAYMDVFQGSEEGEEPPARLMSLPNVVITPHIAVRADIPQAFSLDLFCQSLRKLLDGKQIENVVDWARGY